MTELSASIEPNCVYFACFSQHTNMLISCGDLSYIQVIKESDLSRGIPLLSVTYINYPNT